MKNISTLLIAFLMLSISSCKKDAPIAPVKNPESCNETNPQMLNLEIDMVFNDLIFEEDQSFQLNDTTYINFTEAYIYLSNISLESDNQLSKTPDDVVLVNKENQSFQLGLMDIKDYTGIKISFGIDSLRNHADPTQYPAKHPLGLQNPSMHWSWNQGYIFALLEGNFSNNPIDDNNLGQPWTYHIGLDGNYQESSIIPISINVSGCKENILRLKINMAKIFDGVDIFTENATLTSNFFELSNRVGNNIIHSVSYEN